MLKTHNWHRTTTSLHTALRYLSGSQDSSTLVSQYKAHQASVFGYHEHLWDMLLLTLVPMLLILAWILMLLLLIRMLMLFSHVEKQSIRTA